MNEPTLLKDISFGDIDAKNEILKQMRSGNRDFFYRIRFRKKLTLMSIEMGRNNLFLA